MTAIGSLAKEWKLTLQFSLKWRDVGRQSAVGQECGLALYPEADLERFDDGRGVPLSIIVTAANVNDGKRIDEVLSAMCPRTRANADPPQQAPVR
jgi:hypothetical protein